MVLLVEKIENNYQLPTLTGTLHCGGSVVYVLFSIVPIVFGGFCDRSLLRYAVHFVLSCFAINPAEEERAGCFVSLSYLCNVDVRSLCLSLTMMWVRLQFVNVAFNGHTQFLLGSL